MAKTLSEMHLETAEALTAAADDGWNRHGVRLYTDEDRFAIDLAKLHYAAYVALRPQA